MWCWRRMEKISWTHHVRNEGVLIRVNEHRNILHEIRKRKANWIGHILRSNCLLQQVIEGKIKAQIEVTRRRGRRRKKLLDDLKDRRGYCQLKEEALDRTVWRNRFGRGFGPVVWQITDDDDENDTPHRRHGATCDAIVQREATRSTLGGRGQTFWIRCGRVWIIPNEGWTVRWQIRQEGSTCTLHCFYRTMCRRNAILKISSCGWFRCNQILAIQSDNMITHHESNFCPCCTAVTTTLHRRHDQVLHILPQPSTSFWWN